MTPHTAQPVDPRALLACAADDRDRLVAIRRDLHMHPEVALHEQRTAALVERELDDLGIPHGRVGATGVLAEIAGTGAGAEAGRAEEKAAAPVVALRADMDALPVEETNDACYRSRVPGVKHACGHDLHTACLLGAARLIARHRDAFAGTVRLMFQPAEEIGRGARPFVEAGALEGVRRIFGLHCASDLPSGTVGVKPGVNNASVDHFTIRVHGRSAHVSTPQRGVDALYIASSVVVGLQALATRRTSPVDPIVIGVGTFNAGTTYNALAAEAVLEGTTRTVSAQLRAQIRAQIDALVCATAQTYGGTAEVAWEDFTAPLVNDPTACAEARAVVDAVAGPGHVRDDRALSLGGDNFADLMVLPDPPVPGAYLYLGTANPAVPGSSSSNHSKDFDVDEGAIPLGAAVLAGCALHALGALRLPRG